MLPRSHRLTDSRQIKRVFKEGLRFNAPAFSVLALVVVPQQPSKDLLNEGNSSLNNSKSLDSLTGHNELLSPCSLTGQNSLSGQPSLESLPGLENPESLLSPESRHRHSRQNSPFSPFSKTVLSGQLSHAQAPDRLAIKQVRIKTAFVVSKKVHKRAVIRNGLRRRVREALRLELQRCPHVAGWPLHLIVLPRLRADETPFPNLQTQWQQVLQQLANAYNFRV